MLHNGWVGFLKFATKWSILKVIYLLWTCVFCERTHHQDDLSKMECLWHGSGKTSLGKTSFCRIPSGYSGIVISTCDEIVKHYMSFKFRSDTNNTGILLDDISSFCPLWYAISFVVNTTPYCWGHPQSVYSYHCVCWWSRNVRASTFTGSYWPKERWYNTYRLSKNVTDLTMNST